MRLARQARDFGDIQDGGESQFDPSSLTPYFWFESDSGITEAGNRISAWASRVNGFVPAQGAGANQPLYVPVDAAYNNKPTVHLDDINRFLAAGSLALSFPSSTFIYGEVFGVGLYGPGLLGVPTSYAIQFRSGADAQLYAADLAGATYAPTLADASGQKRSLYIGMPVSKNVTMTRNASATIVTNNPDLPVGLAALDALYIGFVAALTNTQKIAAYLGFQRELTPGEVTQLHEYCVAKYG